MTKDKKDKEKKRKYTGFIIGIGFGIAIILFILDYSLKTIMLWEIGYFLLITISILIINQITKDKEKKEKVVDSEYRLTTEGAREECMRILKKEGIFPEKMLFAKDITIQPATYEKSPATFYVVLVRDAFDYEYKLISLDVKTLRYNIERSVRKINYDEIRQKISDSAPSKIEFIKTKRQAVDMYGNPILEEGIERLTPPPIPRDTAEAPTLKE